MVRSYWEFRMGDKAAPSGSQRQECYVARDAFYDCKAKHGGEEGPCSALREVYHGSCLPSWVKYFDKKRVYDEYKKKLESEGFQPLQEASRKR